MITQPRPAAAYGPAGVPQLAARAARALYRAARKGPAGPKAAPPQWGAQAAGPAYCLCPTCLTCFCAAALTKYIASPGRGLVREHFGRRNSFLGPWEVSGQLRKEFIFLRSRRRASGRSGYLFKRQQ